MFFVLCLLYGVCSCQGGQQTFQAPIRFLAKEGIVIDQATKALLHSKMNFTQAALHRLDQEPMIAEKVFKLIEAIKSPNQPTEVKVYAQNQLKSIRAQLQNPVFGANQALIRERRAYYSFF